MYRYYNANPGKLSEQDCVTRAISTALSLPYMVTRRLIRLCADNWRCDEMCVCCYHHLLEDLYGMSPVYPEDETVEAVSSSHPDDKVIIRIQGHLTCSIHGVILDTWDCRDEPVDVFWVV